MKKIYQYSIIALAILFTSSGCSNFDDINTDPNTTTKVTAALLATNIIQSLAAPGVFNENLRETYLQGRYIGWSEALNATQYNYVGRSSFNFHYIVDSEKMIEYTVGTKSENAYKGLATFTKAYKLFYTSMDLGDIPYSESGMGEHGITQPKYDTQKDVMLKVLNDLDAAYNYFNTAEQGLEGDYIYKGDNDKWKRAVSAFQLKVLVFLSKKEDDADLKIKSRFKDILTTRALLRSNADNLQTVYANKAGMIQPLHPTQTSHSMYPVVSGMIIDLLKKYGDYRLFYHANPATSKITDEGLTADNWDAYMPLETQLPFDQFESAISKGKGCRLNDRLVKREEGEPFWKLSYADMNFVIAEGILRGWASGNASDYYLQGIKAGLEFTRTYTPNETQYTHGRPITDAYITDHLADPRVQLIGNFDKNLEMILNQRYINAFMQINDRDSFYNNRRTGYPTFFINPETNKNTIKEKLPLRYMYPSAEASYNSTNLQESIDRQYSGVDDINNAMWLLK